MSADNTYRYIGRSTPRVDAREKVTGQTVFPTDRYLPGMLIGKALRSSQAHAAIVRLDVERVRALPGVHAVLTHRDIPGHNGFGIITPNWPVLCEDRVKYRGDAIALVAADDEEIAEEALSLIEVEYEPLTVLDTPDEALREGAVRIHKGGNILHSLELKKGDIGRGFQSADIIREATYQTQFMEHAYIETEGGVAVYDEDEGTFTVWAGGQYAFRDQLQIARTLNWDPAKIRVIATPVGGAFGGKDEISFQIHAALLAYYTRRPIRIHWSREESMVVSSKRHAMSSIFKLGADTEGRLQSLEVEVTANVGPYDTTSDKVLNLALESASGPYRVDSTRLSGIAVYTNNIMGGTFRGFGNPKVVFGMEQELDKLAEELGMDPIELRLKNAVTAGDLSGLGHRLEGSVGIRETLLAARRTDLWCRRGEIKRELNRRFPDYRFGIGVASTFHTVGLGKGFPDFANVRIELQPDGTIILQVGTIEIGQGNLTAYSQILAEALECEIERIEIISGDTALTPDAGSVTGSRSVVVVGNAILKAVEDLKTQLIRRAAGRLGIPENALEYRNEKILVKAAPARSISWENIVAANEAEGGIISALGTSTMAVAEEDFGHGLPHKTYSYITQLALVGVDTGTGQVEVVRMISLPEIGKAINVAGVEGQVEGSVVMGQGYALMEEVVAERGDFLTRGFSTYIIPTALDVPEQETIIVEVPEKTGPFGAKGVGELPTCSVAPVIANAIHDAVGIRLQELPMTPEKVWKAMQKNEVPDCSDNPIYSCLPRPTGRPIFGPGRQE
jgi:CO/xanthine dehydrogenase Mo-binding subunit